MRMSDINQGGSVMKQPATAPPESAMNGNTLRRTVTIVNPHGFHMRPQMYFAQRAQQCQSDVALTDGSTRVDGKSPLDLMMLSTAQELTVEVTGPDAAEAVESLAAILAAPSADEEPPSPKKG